jgi:hypothetical protein
VSKGAGKSGVPAMTPREAAWTQREATREARGATSKKARQAVKGAAVGVTVTPVVAGPPVASKGA